MPHDLNKIRATIASMTAICDKGKKEVTALVESIIGEPLTPPPPPFELKIGGVYRYPTSGLLLIPLEEGPRSNTLNVLNGESLPSWWQDRPVSREEMINKLQSHDAILVGELSIKYYDNVAAPKKGAS